MKKIKVAQILSKGADSGTEAVVRNYCEAIGTEVDWIIIIHNECKLINQEFVSSIGGKLYVVPPYKKIVRYEKKLEQIFKEEKVDIVHSNLSTVSFLPLRAAKRAGIQVRIAESHTTTTPKEHLKNFLKKVFRNLTMRYANDFFACSKLAGEFQFGKWVESSKIFVLPNAVSFHKFEFKKEKREQIRKKLGIDSKNKLLGFIGRLEKQKNPLFCLKVMKYLPRNYSLIVIGQGTLKEQMTQKASELKNQIIFLDTMKNIEDVYNALDGILVPSLFEGFGNVALEAQINGLNIFASPYLPKEVNILHEKFHVISIDKDAASEWGRIIIENSTNFLNDGNGRYVSCNKFDQYDINKAKLKLLNRYKEDLKRTNVLRDNDE